MALMQLHIYSNVLQMNMDVWAILPEEMPPNSTLKHMLFLHGGSGDHTKWVRNSNIERDALKAGIAVFMPGAHKSCFTNVHGWHKYNEYIGSELPIILRNMFPALSHNREDTWVAGFSNGGYGAFLISLTYPETFGYACPAGAGDKADIDWAGLGRLAEKDMLFGLETDMPNSSHSVKFLAQKLLDENRPLPTILHGCGENDPWVTMNRFMRDFFTAHNAFDYTYLEFPGIGHTTQAMELAYTEFFRKMTKEPSS